MITNIKTLNKIVLAFGVAVHCFFICGCKEDKIQESGGSSNPSTIEVENTMTDIENNAPLGDNVNSELEDVYTVEESGDTEGDNISEKSEYCEKKQFTFYDVFRNEYTIDTNPLAYKNKYKNDSYTYVGVDVNGNTLSEIEITDDTDIFIPGTEATGYTGIIKYEDEKYTSKFGIDVSKFQGNVNWEKVKSAGVEFAFVRVGFRGYGASGSLSEDAKYRRNIEGARAAGLDVGVYFYAQAINEEEALEEAEYVLNLISGYDLQLPIVYDPEHVLNDTARTDDVSGEQFTLNTIAFCNRIREAGYVPMTYANMLWEGYELDMAKLSDIEIWYADYELKPQTPYAFKVWQYSQAGHISGIDGSVDLNIMIIPKE